MINAVNELLYKSVEAVDTFLCNQPPGNLGFVQPKGTIPETDGDGNVIMSLEEEQEIQKGVHQLQTLFESAVDNAFDRFELFALRNIFYVKPELVGWFRLAHHKVRILVLLGFWLDEG